MAESEFVVCDNCGVVMRRDKVLFYDHDTELIDNDISGCRVCSNDFSVSGSFEDFKCDYEKEA